ncbi:carboxylesterase family protein, partial [Schumannella luteola]
RITLAGESAGGALVAALLMRPGVAERVAGAIVESGPLVAEPPERAGRVTRELATVMRRPATAESFREVAPTELLAARSAQSAGSTPLSGTPGFTLCLDPASLPVSPVDGLAAVDAPLVIGTNTDEYRLWLDPAALARIGSVKLRLAALATRMPGRAVRAYRDAWPDASPGELLGQLATDRLLRADAVAVAEARAAATHLYEFTWPSPVRDLRAAHALELGFVFDALDTDDARRMAGDAAPQALADRMHGDWVRFVTQQSPGWSPFRDGGRVRRYDTETTEVPLPRAEALATLRRRRPHPDGRRGGAGAKPTPPRT